MKFLVDSKIFERFPGVEIGVLVIKGIDNKGHYDEILKLLRAEEKKQKELLVDVEMGSLPEISAWRKIYRELGSNPKDFRSSVEALLRRARGGEKPIPQINNLVDLYNYISLKYHLPAGAEDLDKTEGDISLTFANGSEKGVYIGSSEVQNCDLGEVIYKDMEGFICRKWNWREADRTKIDKDTKQAVLVIEKVPEVSKEVFNEAIREAEKLLKNLLQGEVQSHILNSNKPSISFDLVADKTRIVKKAKITGRQEKREEKVKKIQQKILNPASELLEKNLPMIQQMIKVVIEKVVAESFEKVKLTENFIKIEHPKINNYGDYSTNIAMILTGQLKMKPIEAAEKLSRKIDEYIREHQMISVKADSNSDKSIIINVSDILENVKFELPGFVNLFIAKKWLISQVDRVLNNDWSIKTGQTDKVRHDLSLTGLKISVEYTDPNPFKEFHLGHLYSNVIGEAVARLYEENGATVWRADFYGDAGMHIAKSVWGMMTNLKSRNIGLEDLEKLSLNKRQRFLGEGYALGVSKYEEDKEIAEQIKDINYSVYVAAQEVLKKERNWKPIIDYKKFIQGKENQYNQVRDVYEAGLRWSLEYFESIYKRLGTKFDGYYPESWVGELGMKTVEKGLKSGVLEKSEGAVVYKGEKEGLHTRVFINKLGLPTYETKDLGLALAKFQDFPYDMSINIFGKEIDEYYYVVKAVLMKIEPELGKKAFHLAHGMVKLPEGKMSSRTGNVITFEWLLNEAKKRTLQIMEKISLPEQEKQITAEKVALGAIRYALLKSNIGHDVIFDFGKSVTFEGDSGPYLMYTYARCRSGIRKADDATLKTDEEFININNEEMELLRMFYKFEEVVWEAARNLAPSLVCSYLYDLAQKFNLFYQKHTILGGNEEYKKFRLTLTAATAVIIKRGLYLLGIETVERM